MTARCLHYVMDYYPHGGGEFALAIAIADDADDAGANVRIGVPTMARRSRQSERTVQRQLAKMQADGWLQVVQQGNGRGVCGHYRINPQWVEQCAHGGVRPSTEDPDGSGKGCQSVTLSADKGCQNVTLSTEKGCQSVTLSADKGRQNVTLLPVDNFRHEVLFPPPLIPPHHHKKRNDSHPVDAGDLSFCKRFLATLRQLNPQHSEPRNWERWCRDVRLMRETDGHSREQIADMMRWVSADPFWQANILSPGKLRQKWDQLAARRAADALKASGQGAVTLQPVNRACACGCGKPGTRGFRTDGSEWWADACYRAEKLRREQVIA